MKRLEASGSSRTRSPPPPSSPKKLNDHIHELYLPTEEPSMDILFFHGLQLGDTTEAYKSTWTCGDDSGEIWPSTWLVEEFPKAHVFSVSYDGSMMKTEKHGRFDLYTVAENLIQAICSEDIGQALGRPLILVGHSFGGLVIKSLYLKAHYTHGLGLPGSESTQKIERFLQNMAGVFFYGTPHRGSSLFDKAASFLGGPLLPYVKVLSTESARLDSEFTAACKKYEMWHIASVGESLPTSWGLFPRGLVVPEASARYGLDFCTAKANHITLCQPESKTSTSFNRLKTFLQDIHLKVEARQVEARFENKQRTPKPLVGVDLAMKKVEDILQENKKVGLVGMGGVGKTTLAMAMFNKLGPTFEYTCFIHVMKEISGSVEDLKKEVWSRLHCHGKKVVDSYGEGSWSKLEGKRFLLVLDDIFEKSNRDLDILSHIADDNGHSESRFIVTSRNGGRLNKMDKTYQVAFLDHADSKQLFMSCAFPRMLVAPIALESNVEAIIQKCGGLPLTLEVIGSYLRGETDVKVWTQTLDDLDKANVIDDEDERLWAQLRLSYDSLREEQQEMFLDAATFFAGTDWTLREAKAAWSIIYGSEDRRWKNLVDMSLVYYAEEDETIRVHEQLQSLGRKIASESKKKCRIWNFTEVLKLQPSTDESDDLQVHTLQAKEFSQDPNSISRTWCRRLKTVRCLDLKFFPIRIVGAGSEVFPTDHLVLLGCYPEEFGYLFSKLTLGRLVVLRFCGDGDLPKSIDSLSALKILNISFNFSVRSLPDAIGCLSRLEYLTINMCPHLCEFPESFGALFNLKDLELIDCPELKTLPESFGQLRALECLKLEGVVTLPDSFGHLPALRNLEIRSCFGMYELPKSFGHLRALKHLGFFESYELHILPESFGQLSALESLEFHTCPHLKDLPESFGQLSALESLEFHNCPSLKDLPESFGQLSALESLEFHTCHDLKDLPESFGQLSALESLEFRTCSKMYELPKSFGHLRALKHLGFFDCYELHILPESFGQLSALESLEFHTCPNLKDLPESFGQLSALLKMS